MIQHSFLENMREIVKDTNDQVFDKRLKWIKSNVYYYNQLLKCLRFIIPPGSKVLHLRCNVGYLLNNLQPAYGVGIEESPKLVEYARNQYPHLKFIHQSSENLKLDEAFDYILIYNLEDVIDIQAVLKSAKNCCKKSTRIVLINYNYLWNPLVKLAEKLGLKTPQGHHNWISERDVNNFLQLSGYEKIIRRNIILYPFNIPGFSYLCNRFLAKLPLFRYFCLLQVTTARYVERTANPDDLSVSVIVPCKNEAGNIKEAVERIPVMGSGVEIIFCDDKSTDSTAEEVRMMIKKYPEKNIRLIDGPGICKAENVWVGFEHAKNDVLMILDADLTVLPEELPYFYDAIADNRGEFINGSRLIYPMHQNAMPFLNVMGNKFFSLFFSYILDYAIKDTLCGTKVIRREDYMKIKELRGTWGIDDRWGDYELIFGAAKCHLKHIDLPVHYYERVTGETKMINRFKNAKVMFRMCTTALFKIKFFD